MPIPPDRALSQYRTVSVRSEPLRFVVVKQRPGALIRRARAVQPTCRNGPARSSRQRTRAKLTEKPATDAGERTARCEHHVGVGAEQHDRLRIVGDKASRKTATDLPQRRYATCSSSSSVGRQLRRRRLSSMEGDRPRDRRPTVRARRVDGRSSQRRECERLLCPVGD